MNRREYLKYMLVSVGTLAISKNIFADDSNQPSAAAIEKWKSLTPEQKEALREKYRKFKSLPADQRMKLIENSKRYQSLSPEQKQRILENHRRFENLNPEQREKIRERYQKFKSLPPEKREEIRKRIRARHENRVDRRFDRRDGSGGPNSSNPSGTNESSSGSFHGFRRPMQRP